MTIRTGFSHEELDVYHLAVAFEVFAANTVTEHSPVCAYVDHLERASEGIVDGIVCGDSKWSSDAKCQHFGFAYGSALECAACLDLGLAKRVVSEGICNSGKAKLLEIVRMIVGLIRSHQDWMEARETEDEYHCGNPEHVEKYYFNHERLQVYRQAVSFVCWIDALMREQAIAKHFARRFDELSTSVVLNVAEGNGRFGRRDHGCFVETAYESALKSASLLDRMQGRGMIDTDSCIEGKALLEKTVRMLVGLRRYLVGGKNENGEYRWD